MRTNKKAKHGAIPTSASAKASVSGSAEKKANSRGAGTPGDFVFSMKDVSKVLPDGRALFRNVSMGFWHGAKIGLLGANGSGKSSFMKVLAGIDKDFDGEVWIKGGLRVGYLAQEPALAEDMDVIGNVLQGVQTKARLVERYHELSQLMGEPDADFDALLKEQGELQIKIDDSGAWELRHQVTMAMAALNLPPPDARVESLSGGEKRRVALCKLLLEEPDVLMLDEPTNHLDADSVSWLEQFLQNYRGTVIAVTHDRYFLDNVAAWILEIDRGQALPFEGGYGDWLEAKRARLNLEQKADAVKAKMMDQELEWIRKGARGGNKARIERAEATLSGGGGEEQRVESGAIIIAPGPRLGRKVIDIKNISKRFNGENLFDDLSFTIERGSIVGVVGPNGCGKSTLFSILGGRAQPDTGSVEHGESVRMGHVSQTREGLHPDYTVYQEISQGNDRIFLNGREVHMRAYVGAFNLKGPVQEKFVAQLSGGERNRVHLAKVMSGGFNVLLLDEPTNDLDVETLRALEEALRNFDGAAIIISHDRWFLNRLCTHTLAFEGAGRVAFFPGNFSEYEADRMRRLGKDAVDLTKTPGKFKNIVF